MGVMSDDAEICFALVDLKTGTPLALSEGVGSSRLQDLCSAAPELFRAGAPAELAALLARLSANAPSAGVQEIVFMSPHAVHVVQRVARKPELALLAVSEDTHKLGLMLSGVRARALQLESRQEVEVP